MDGWTWLAFYVGLALVGGITASNVIRAIERQGELTRAALAVLAALAEEITDNLERIDSNLDAIQTNTRAVVPEPYIDDGPS